MLDLYAMDWKKQPNAWHSKSKYIIHLLCILLILKKHDTLIEGSKKEISISHTYVSYSRNFAVPTLLFLSYLLQPKERYHKWLNFQTTCSSNPIIKKFTIHAMLRAICFPFPVVEEIVLLLIKASAESAAPTLHSIPFPVITLKCF